MRKSLACSAARARAIAWLCVGLAGMAGALLLARERTPYFALDFDELRGLAGNRPINFLFAAAFALFVFVLGTKIFLALVGQPWAYRSDVTKRLVLSPFEAEEIADHASAAVLEFGFAVGPKEPLSGGGWIVTACKKCPPPGGDPRRRIQSLEFRFDGAALNITHRLGKGWDWCERGEADYQEWLVEAIASGAPLDTPPRRLALLPIWMLLGACFASTLAVLLGGLPPEARRTWEIGHAVALLGCLTMTGVWPVLMWIERRWTSAKDVYIAAIALVAFSALKWWPPAPDEKEAFAWFDTLGYPDVAGCKYVKVTGAALDRPFWGGPRYAPHGFLVVDDDDSFSVFGSDLVVRTFKTSVGYEVCDLALAARDLLAALKKPYELAKQRFGEHLALRAEIFVFARGCASNGLHELARDLCAEAARIPDGRTGRIDSRPFREVVAAEIAHAVMWRAILDFEDTSISREHLLAKFHRFLLLFPDSEHAPAAREIGEQLARMIEEERARKPRPFAEMNAEERVAELIFQLRDQNGHQWWQPGWCDILEDPRGERSPAHQLVKIGYDAVPQLIEALEDRRLTRSVGFHRNFYFSHHVLRVGDCALAVLEQIAGSRLYERTYTNAQMVKDGEEGTTKARARAWWAEHEAEREK